MSFSGLILVAVAVGLAAGCLLAAQPSINGQLGHHVTHPLQASLISFASGTALLLLVTVSLGVFPPKLVTPIHELPWWIWTGGSIGVVLVTSSLILVPKVGSLPWFAAVMTGQTVAAIMLDHYGMLGNPKAPASPLRMLGGALMIAGVMVIVYAKQSEQRSVIESAINSPIEQAGENR